MHSNEDPVQSGRPSGINDAMPSTSTGKGSLNSEESQWLPSWQCLDEFKKAHDASVLSETDEISHNGAPTMPTEECGATSVSSTSMKKTKGRPAGKKKMSAHEKKQKKAERMRLAR